MGIEILRYADPGLEDPIGIVGFPSVGLISSIAANYFVTQLDMTPVAGMGGEPLPPYCLMADGKAFPPIRIYGKPRRTKTGRDIVICTSEYAPRPEDCHQVASAVLDALRDLGCREVVCLEGVPRTSESDGPVICGSGTGIARILDSSGLPSMGNGVIKGLTGVMMYLAQSKGMTVSTIFGPANPNMPDPSSAIAYIEPLSKIVKGMKVSPKALEQEGEEIRRRLESEQATVQRDHPENMLYG